MSKKDIHVVPHPEGWATKKEGAEKAGRVFETKQEAMEQGREQAKRENVELVPHKKDGTVQNPNSYGNDPNPPKDKKH